MSDPGRDTQDSHPETDLLLRFLEDDLPEKERRLLARHLSGCWTCKVQIEEIQAGIRGFMEFREEMLLPATPIDPRAIGVRDRVLRRVREESPPSRPNLMLSLVSAPLGSQPALFRPAWIAGCLSLIVFCLFFFSTPIQPRLMAGEFLEHVESSLVVYRARERGHSVRQRVRIRRDASFVDREVVRGRPGTQETAASIEPAWIGAAGLMSGPLTWDDPLAADAFVRWRRFQTVRREEVTTRPGLLILTVAVGDNAPGVIRRVSLVVRRSDWHIVAKRVESQSGPGVEATEIAYEVRDEPAIARSPATSASVKNLRGSSPEHLAAVAAPGEDPDETEIRVRSALFHLGFGLGAEEISPSVHRLGRMIAVRGVVSSAERRAQLSQALQAIPNTIDQIAETVTLPLAGKMTAIAGVRPSVATRPPQLRQLLIERLGSEKNATDFSNEALTDAGKTLAIAVYYHELAQRYPPAEADAILARSREQLSALVSAVEHELRLNLQKETARLESIHGEPFGPLLDIGDPAWQGRAERSFHLALEHDQLVSLLFAVTSREAPKPEGAGANLDRLEQLDRAMTSILHDSAVR